MQKGFGVIYMYSFGNGMKYIGMTERDIKTRHREHMIGNQKIDAYLRKHPDFELSILGEYPSELLSEKEIFFILKYNTCPSLGGKGLNMMIGDPLDESSWRAYIHSDEHAEKRSAYMKKLTSTEEWKAYQSNLMKEKWANPEWKKKNNEKIQAHHRSEEFREICKERMLDKWKDEDYVKKQKEGSERYRQSEQFVLDRKTASEKMKELWTDETFRAIQEERINKLKEDGFFKKNSRETRGKAVCMYSLSGEIEGWFSSITEAVEFLSSEGEKVSNIYAVCKDKKGQSLNHQWRYLEEDTPLYLNKYIDINAPKSIMMYDLQHNFIRKFKSSKEACRFLGIPKNRSGAISRVCKGLAKTACGYIWEYEVNQ